MKTNVTRFQWKISKFPNCEIVKISSLNWPHFIQFSTKFFYKKIRQSWHVDWANRHGPAAHAESRLRPAAPEHARDAQHLGPALQRIGQRTQRTADARGPAVADAARTHRRPRSVRFRPFAAAAGTLRQPATRMVERVTLSINKNLKKKFKKIFKKNV